MKRLFSTCLLVILVVSQTVLAGSPLLAGSDLVNALKSGPPCCVIDGRQEANRTQAPLAEALPYRSGLRINPTASVVVVADTDQEAQRIADVLARQHPGKTIIAVKGGLPSWQAANAAPLSTATHAGAPAPGFQFVIPHNTCESGEPLQKLQSNKK